MIIINMDKASTWTRLRSWGRREQQEYVALKGVRVGQLASKTNRILVNPSSLSESFESRTLFLDRFGVNKTGKLTEIT